MKKYKVKEIFHTLQGEGYHTGRAAVFCRFSGCNLWNGKEESRANAVCKICDTDFVGGHSYSLESLVNKILDTWSGDTNPFVVFTGGEPGLQLDDALVAELHSKHCYIAVESNGTCDLPAKIDWITISPKTKELTTKVASELKVLYPTYDPLEYSNFTADHYFISPTDSFNNIQSQKNLNEALQFCLNNSKWKLNLQTHKLVGLP